MVYLSGINLAKLYTKQIECIILNFEAMRLICMLLMMSVVSTGISGQVTYDTTFTRQWNSSTSNWEDFDRIITSIENGLVTSELIQVTKEEQWVNYNFKAYYYENGRVKEEFEQYWNESKFKWEDNYRKLYSYDGEGKLMMILHQNIFKGKYINSSKEIMIYSADGQLKEKIIQKFSDTNKEVSAEKAWSNFLRYQYYYNANDLLINENLAEWNKDSWDNSYICINYNYDYQGNLIEKLKQKVTGSNTRNLLQESFSYNEFNKPETHYIAEWNKHSKAWIADYKTVYENGTSDNAALVIHKMENGKWNNYLASNITSNGSAKNTDFSEMMAFSLSPVNSGNRASLKFSNPYNESYYVSVHNAEGQLICSSLTNKDEFIFDTVDLDSGLYFVELQGSNLYSGKFSIE